MSRGKENFRGSKKSERRIGETRLDSDDALANWRWWNAQASRVKVPGHVQSAPEDQLTDYLSLIIKDSLP